MYTCISLFYFFLVFHFNISVKSHMSLVRRGLCAIVGSAAVTFLN